MLEVGLLLVSLGIILLGAEIFTNGVEWLGRLLRLSEGAVGSVLAAVGTALPETMIPVIAILSGKEGGEEIGIGAILGAPFMLGTLAFGITGLAVIFFRNRRQHYPRMKVDTAVIRRDLIFFLIVYSIAILAAFIPLRAGRLAIALLLVLAYVIYLYYTFKGKSIDSSLHDIRNLYLAGRNMFPRIRTVLLQIGLALGVIVFGAHIFVDTIKELSKMLEVPTFILALIIAPVATELPEKFNSIIWVRNDKDTLALGNITGAMVFQSSLIPALGITMTGWALTSAALTSAVLVIISAGVVYWQISRKNYLTPAILLSGIVFYVVFVFLIGYRII
ncbi:MAG: sodium:calcium antiporter [Clostridia bacterium]|nr:sodium:calcium antiporter [Clostridia bacterium]